MANYFDQFDEKPSKNFFDQFDQPAVKPDTGFTGALKSSAESLKGDISALLGKTGLMDEAKAEQEAKEHKAKSEAIFQPTKEGWTEAPWTKFKETLGGSVPYMAAPLVAGAAASLAPEAAIAGGLISAADLAAGAVGIAQFTGSNLSAQMDTGKSLANTSLLAAGAAAVPQAALDVWGMHMVPGIRNIFKEAGKEITEAEAKQIAKTGLMANMGKFAASGINIAKAPIADGLNEAGQQVFERLQAGLSLTDEKARDDYFQNFIGGAVLGGVLAVPGHLYEKSKAPKGVAGEAAPEENKIVEPPPISEPVTMAGVENTGAAPVAPPLTPPPPALNSAIPPIQTNNAGMDVVAPITPAAPTEVAAPIAPAVTAPQQLEAPQAITPTTEEPKNLINYDEDKATLKRLYADKNKLANQPSQFRKFIKSVGGINPSEKKDVGGQDIRVSNLFNRKTGLSLDELTSRAIDQGILQPSGDELQDVANMREHIADVINGTKFPRTGPDVETVAKLNQVQEAIDQIESQHNRQDEAREIAKGFMAIPEVAHIGEGINTLVERGHPVDQNSLDILRQTLEEKSRPQMELAQQTPEELRVSEANRLAQEATANEEAQRQEAEAQAMKDRAEIAARSQEAAGTFELGQTAEDNLSGQQSLIPRNEVIETPHTDKFLADADKLAKSLRNSLNLMGLKDVALNLEDSVYNLVKGKMTEVNATYFNKLISLSLSGENMVRSLNHEAIHAMKDLGFFSEKDWNILTKEAEKTWMEKYNIADRYSDVPYEVQLEEAVANAFGDRMSQPPKVRSILDKALNIIKRIGNVLRGNGYKTAEDIFGKAERGGLKATTGPTNLAPLSEVKSETAEKLTKVKGVQTAGKVAINVAKEIQANINNDAWWTKKRIEWIDKNSGLTKTLSSLPIFDMNGQLRADMLARTQDQMINLIRNGLQTGVIKVNSDGTLVVDTSEDNLARSMIVADKINGKKDIDGNAISGRNYVAEVARILRGEEIINEDKARHAEGVQQLATAKKHIKEARKIRDQLNDLYDSLHEKEKNLPRKSKDRSPEDKARVAELTKLEKDHLSYAKFLRTQGYINKAMNRELQVKSEDIKWAKQQLASSPELKEVLDIWRKVNEGLIQLREDSGLLTKEQADKYRKNTSYVPLFKSSEDLEDKPGVKYGTGTKTVDEIKRLQGSMATRNIWENLHKHYASTVSLAYQNQTRKIATEQLKSLGAAEIVDSSDPRVNLRFRDPTSEFADKNGIVSAVVDNPNDLAAFQMMHYELGPLLSKMAKSTQVLRAGALVNPMYWIKQLIRDPIHATLVANSGIVTPFHSAKDFIGIIAKNSEEAKILARHGVIGQIDSTIDIHKFLNQVGKEKTDPSRLQKMLHKVMEIHEASDAATRVSIYKKAFAKAKKEGMNDAMAENFAVHKARESINFAVHGNSATLNSIRHAIPFFSAALTSLDTVYRAATGHGLNPKERTEAMKTFYTRAAMMSVMCATYAMMYQDNDDYKKLPDYVKDNNWLIPSPISDHSFIKVPVPFEVGFLFKTIPEASVRYMNGTSTGKEVLASYKNGIINNLPGGGIPVPQAGKPILEAITNYSFFTGRPIEGMSDQGLPVEKRGQNASELSKSLSSLGLSHIGLSPAKIDYLIQGYTAELGTFTSGLVSSSINYAEGKTPPAKNIEEIEGFKAFLTNPNASKAVADFYDLEHNAQETVNYFNKMKAQGDIEGVKEYISDEDKRNLMAASPSLRKVGTQMTEIRKQIKFVQDNQKMDPEERRVKINSLEDQLHKVASLGYKIAEATKIER